MKKKIIQSIILILVVTILIHCKKETTKESESPKKVNTKAEAISLNETNPTIQKSKVACGDLWGIYDVKPDGVAFIDCKKGEGQTIVEATYKVKGANITSVENLLVKKYGMAKLKFVCCGYEPENGILGHIKSKKMEQIDLNFYIEIVMHSDDSFIKKDGTKKKSNEYDFMWITIRVLDV